MITDEVGDIKSFLINGFGYALVINNKIQGFCTTEYHSERALALGVEVLESHRRKGYAKAMAAAALNIAVSKGSTVYWECWQYNTPSKNTALSCGFKHEADYPMIFMDFEK